LGGKFAAALYGEYRFSMSVSEIETAFRQLSVADPEELLRRLENTLRFKRHAGQPETREEWMQRLHALRASISAGAPTFTSDEILTDLRGE
jgi:hypothetical protein